MILLDASNCFNNRTAARCHDDHLSGCSSTWKHGSEVGERGGLVLEITIKNTTTDQLPIISGRQQRDVPSTQKKIDGRTTPGEGLQTIPSKRFCTTIKRTRLTDGYCTPQKDTVSYYSLLSTGARSRHLLFVLSPETLHPESHTVHSTQEKESASCSRARIISYASPGYQRPLPRHVLAGLGSRSGQQRVENTGSDRRTHASPNTDAGARQDSSSNQDTVAYPSAHPRTNAVSNSSSHRGSD